MHEKAQPSLPSLHVTTNPNMNSTKRIHARMIIEPNVKDIISLPRAQQIGSYNQQFRRVPLKLNPKVVQAFSPYQSYSIISFSDFLYEKHKKEKQLQKLKDKKQLEKLKDIQNKEKIKYFQQEDENNEDIIDSIMEKVRVELGQQQMQSNFITN
ncbi:unnamed protein product (macronuclear) [Paramecium tetraurelia]|uniref:Uncharacterized protein n=1 Tax=Paramecium tetraurelia TaxID=5888 RepID=A0BEF7_PARTE|nr:uncharacterized protein GSPATT00027957001 [Paramecium tetraurelia]CAK56924.1 unnamed protein product [Paramecium tetraurelia]|eukprot:XP_001424322.1 hypothetical protein (macronuclear) [Paramecium tetraurelia strain d4-2]